MKKFLLILSLATSVAFFSGCGTGSVTLEPGGAYTQVSLVQTDQDILTGSHALDGFIKWASDNAAALAQWPEIGQAASRVSAQRDGWVKDAWAARDAYANVLVAYQKGSASSADVSAAQQKLNTAMAVITAITTEITAYQAQHPSHA